MKPGSRRIPNMIVLCVAATRIALRGTTPIYVIGFRVIIYLCTWLHRVPPRYE